MMKRNNLSLSRVEVNLCELFLLLKLYKYGNPPCMEIYGAEPLDLLGFLVVICWVPQASSNPCSDTMV